MSLRINTNVDAFDVQRNINYVSQDFAKAVQRLSSGLRINSAADDAAGLTISQKLQGQINAFDQSSRNAQDALSMIQASDSALGNTQAMLQRMRQLAVQASSGTYSTADRQNIQAEINHLISEIDRVSQETDFNSKKLLNGSAGGAQAKGSGTDIRGITLQGGVAVATRYTVNKVTNATKSAVEGAVSNGSFFTQDSSITIQGATGRAVFSAHKDESLQTFFDIVNNSGIGATIQIDQANGKVQIVNNYFGINTGTGMVINGPTAVTVVDNGVTYAKGTVFTGGAEAVTVSGATGDFAQTGLKMKFDANVAFGNVNNAGTFTANTAASNAIVSIKSGAAGATAVRVTATGLNSDVITGVGQYAGLSMTLVDPSNITGADQFTVAESASLQYHVGANANQSLYLRIDSASSQALGIDAVSVMTDTDAESAIGTLDLAIATVSAARANMGAISTRLSGAMTTSQTSQTEALTAHANMTDADIASTTVQFTRDQILMQAGTSVLAQANQSSALVLPLLR